ncbi:carboxymuconolactone decarboxylase family protein [Aliifodinibius sp. S!AR15-10]|uniref:carboxymuconolactone decarboxylase family protein n=1 Tax=Aliifodinibius sp. S!AR15-10 TaxID=2950437 RepID=UPI0028624600|nr:carboxymuconolactone decarboxylase family protein [Aliifodinibius sp. S!AR15-10]MDR8389977.1 carboxymuconolactone decarboxylase family protein [Aliifodinibius sp. S!AR15-10]
MEQRINYQKTAQKALKGMYEIEKYIANSELETPLVELVKLRASQINGCAYCIDKHTKEARQAGETEQRLYTLNVWRETSFFSDRERAALRWTEALTRISETDVSDELYESVRKYFAESDLIALTMVIIAINGWNRLTISFRNIPGSYKPELVQ